VRWITSINWDNETPNNPIGRGVNSIQLVNNGRSSNVGVVNPDPPTGYRRGRTAEDERTVTTLTKSGLSRIVGKTLVELYDVEGRNLDVRTRRLFGLRYSQVIWVTSCFCTLTPVRTNSESFRRQWCGPSEGHLSYADLWEDSRRGGSTASPWRNGRRLP
jgi:hypothetical protein